MGGGVPIGPPFNGHVWHCSRTKFARFLLQPTPQARPQATRKVDETS
jgi:hypothetical protein